MTSNQLSEARLINLINSNDVPSDEETSELRHRIVTKKLEVENLDEKIKKARMILDGLIKRREDQQQALISLKHTVSTIRRLPYEILARIFVFCHESSGVKTIGLGLRFLHPLLFGHVCSSWRMVSHSIPTLWRSLSICLTSNMLKAPEGTHELLKEWFYRAHLLPLEVHISSHLGYDMNAQLPFPDRIRKLTLHASFFQFKRLLPHAMPLIEDLELRYPSFSNGHDDWNGSPISFEGSPHLHIVVLNDPVFLQSGMLVLPWLQLTELELNYSHPPDDLLRLLSIATNLEKFVYNAQNVKLRDVPLNLSPIIHRNLRHLSIILDNNLRVAISPVMSFLFRHLTLPALQSGTMGTCGPAELGSFSDLQSRSKFSLEYLAFTMTCWSRSVATTEDVVDRLVRFLHGYPFLRKLRLGIDVYGDGCDRCLEALKLHCYVSEDAGHPLLPCVEELHLICSSIVDGQLIVDMLKTRWWPGHRMQSGIAHLKWFSINTMYGWTFRPSHVVMEQLRELEREGLVIFLNGEKPSSFDTPD